MSSTKTFAWAVILELALIAGSAFGAWVFWDRFSKLKAQRAPFESGISVAPDLCDFPSGGTSRFLFLSLDSSEFAETKQALLRLATKEGREVVTSNEYELPSFSEGKAVTRAVLYLTFSAPVEDAEKLSVELKELPPASLEFGNESTSTQSLHSMGEECERALYTSRTLRLYEQFYLRQLAERGGYDEALGDKVNQMRTTASQLQESLNYLYDYTADKISATITLQEKL